MFAGCTILAFHQCSDRRFPGINNIKPDDFFALLDLLRSWEYLFWNGEDLRKEADDGVRIVITFDDGFRDQFDILRRLRNEGIRPIVFMPAAYIGKRNRWEYFSRFFPVEHLDAGQLRELAESGVMIGSHGDSHRSLANMGEALLRQELLRSKETLESVTGQPVELISFPFGRTNATVNRIAGECGYRRGFILEAEARLSHDDDFIVPRIPVYGIDDYYSLKARLLENSRVETAKNRIINRLSGGTIIISGKAQINRGASENS